MTTGDVTAQPRLDVEYDWEFQCESECWCQSSEGNNDDTHDLK